MNDQRNTPAGDQRAEVAVPPSVGRGLEAILSRAARVDEHLRNASVHISRARQAERAARSVR